MLHTCIDDPGVSFMAFICYNRNLQRAQYNTAVAKAEIA